MYTSTINSMLAAGSRQVFRVTFTGKNESLIITGGSTIVNGVEIPEGGIIQGGLIIDRYSSSGQKVEVGSAIAAELTLRLANYSGIYDDVIFDGGEMFVEVGTKDWSDPDAVVTYIPLGYFDIDSQPRRLSSINISALDRMARFDKKIGTITLPKTVSELVTIACTDCNVTLVASGLTGLPNTSYSVTELPEGFTYRQIIQQCAFLMGSCAYMDYDGKLNFGWYTTAAYTITPDHRMIDSSDLFEGDIVVDGIKYQDADGNEYASHDVGVTPTYTLDYSGCDIFAGNYQTCLDNIWNRIKGLTYRPFKCTVLSAPFLWPLDKISYQNADGSTYTVIVTNITYEGNGATALSGVGESTVQAGWSNFSGLTIAEKLAIAEAQKQTETKITTYYGTCDTAANQSTKVVTCPGFSLITGATIKVAFTYANTTISSGILMNVNGTGDVPIYIGGAAISNTNQFLWAASTVIEFVYNGSAWIPSGSPGTYYAPCDSLAADQNKVATISGIVIYKGVEVILKMTNVNGYNGPGLNISGTGAKGIRVQGGLPLSDTSEFGWTAGATAVFTFDGQFWILGTNHISAGTITVGTLTAITIEGPNTDTHWDLSNGEFQNADSKELTAYLEKTEGTKTTFTYTVDVKTKIDAGELTVTGRKTSPTDDGVDTVFTDEGLQSDSMDYSFYEQLPDDIPDTSLIYPHGGMIARGNQIQSYGGVGDGNHDEDCDHVLYRPKGIFTPDYVELGNPENPVFADGDFAGESYTDGIDRNVLRLTGGWIERREAIMFQQHYEHAKDLSGDVRDFYEKPVICRPAWDIVPREGIYIEKVYAFGCLVNGKQDIMVTIPLARPLGEDVVSVKIAGTVHARQGSTVLLNNVDFDSGIDGTGYDYATDFFLSHDSNISMRIRKFSGSWSAGTLYGVCFVTLTDVMIEAFDEDIYAE